VSANKHLRHVLVLPEDDANRQLANGFHQEIDFAQQRQMQVLPVANGWREVLDLFESVHVTEMGRWQTRYIVLLIDFDNQALRLGEAKARIPANLAERVFVIGSQTKPEDLRSIGSFEAIGSALARDCRDESNRTWNYALLRNNADELERLREHVRPILFPNARTD
jgi:hypothetical protein